MTCSRLVVTEPNLSGHSALHPASSEAGTHCNLLTSFEPAMHKVVRHSRVNGTQAGVM